MGGDFRDSLERLTRSHSIEPSDVVFAEPWQAHVFALVLALAERGHLNFEKFRQSLIAQIAADESNAGADVGYYESWLTALEVQLSADSLSAAEIEQRADDLAANRPLPAKAASAGPIRIA